MRSRRPISFLMLQIPLGLSGLLYFGIAALAVFVTTLDEFDQGEDINRTILLALGLMSAMFGMAAIGLACVCHRPAKWVYYTCFVVTVLYLPSAFLLLGIPMLIFLLKRDVQDHYGVRLG